MSRYIKLLNGAEYEIYRCAASQGILWIGVLNLSVAQAAAVFSDPEATREIISYRDGGIDQQYFNFTDLALVQQDEYGTLVSLKRV